MDQRLNSLTNQEMINELDRQEIFIAPEYRDKKIILEPKQNLTIPALIYVPRLNGQENSFILMKNNYSGLIKIPVVGQSGTVDLIVKKIFKEGKDNLMIPQPHPEENLKKIVFSIEENEIINPDGTPKITTGSYNLQWIERAFVIQNKGKLPLRVDKINIDKKGCFSSGFRIMNCDSFEL